MVYQGIFWSKSKDFNPNERNRYFLGISFAKIAKVFDSSKMVAQIRIGLIWRHCGITFII